MKYLHYERTVFGYSFHFYGTKGLHVKLLNSKKYYGRLARNFTSSWDAGVSGHAFRNQISYICCPLFLAT